MIQLFSRHRISLICLALAAVTLALYWPMTHHDFFNIDDPRFVYQNPHVQAGLTWPGIVWAFHTLNTENWQPLTWVSHMLDCQMYGLNAGGHHFTSLLIHVANSLLVFLWLRQLTQTVWRSAFVAAFFAWHPLHVESVAWICERKDVLSTFFWMLALIAYTGYARRLGGSGDGRGSSRGRAAVFYVLTLVFFGCGLMSKPMVVTLPCVLLLLDFWPLNRFGFLDEPEKRPRLKTMALLIAEKVPFLALTLAISMATLVAQKEGGALSSIGGMPLSMRVSNSLINYAVYLRQTFWPAQLAYFYPYVHNRSFVAVLAVALALAGLTGWFAWRARREPYLLVGWLWFLGTLIPTIGLVHVGIQSRADRYMYIPSIGLFMVMVWGAHRLMAKAGEGEKILGIAGGAAAAGCLVMTSIQLGYWQNSITLSEHAIAVTKNNYVAYESLGRALYDKGLKDEAMDCYLKSVEIEPDFPQSQFNLGLAFRERGQLLEAVEHFAAAVRLVPNRYETRAALGTTLVAMGNGNPDEAVRQLSEALKLAPESPDAHRNLAVALVRKGEMTNAVEQFKEAVGLAPTNADLRFSLGLALLDSHQPADAAAEFSKVLSVSPNDANAHYRLAEALQQQGQWQGAAAHYEAAVRLQPNFSDAAAALKSVLAAHPEAGSREPLDNAH